MKQKFNKFMKGRYGTDVLNMHLTYLALAIALISIIPGLRFLQWFTLGILIIVNLRMFSKKYSHRYEENRKYTLFIWKIKQKFKRRKNKSQYKYIKCKGCGQKLRVPKGKGKIKITCPKCKEQAYIKS